jgi:hypothetical protein
MMRTEDDVRQALRQREREAAPAAEVLSRLQLDVPRPRHRRGRTYVLAAAACVVVAGVVVATMVVAGRHGDRSGSSPSPSPKVTSSVKMPLGPKFEFSFQIGQLPSGYGVVRQVIDPGFQWAEIGWIQPPGCQPPTSNSQTWHPPADCGYGSSGSYGGGDGYVSVADVLVFDKGQFDPSVMKNGAPVDVNGAQGLIADIVPVNDTVKWTVASIMDPLKPPKLTTVAWPYATDSWALVAWRNNTDANARDLALSVARAARIGAKHAALVPFKIEYLPAAVDRRWELTFSETGRNQVGFGSVASKYAVGLHLGIPDWSLPISVSEFSLAERTPRTRGEVSLTVAGQAAVYSPKQSALFVSCGTKCTLAVGYGGLGAHLAGSIGKAELVKIAEHITIAPSLTNTSTWYDAAFALPH